MIREKFDNNIHMVRSYILWIEFFATIYRCSDYSGHGGQDHWCAQTTSWHWQWVATSDTGWPHVTREPPHKRVLQTFTQHSLHKPFLWFPFVETHVDTDCPIARVCCRPWWRHAANTWLPRGAHAAAMTDGGEIVGSGGHGGNGWAYRLQGTSPTPPLPRSRLLSSAGCRTNTQLIPAESAFTGIYFFEDKIFISMWRLIVEL